MCTNNEHSNENANENPNENLNELSNEHLNELSNENLNENKSKCKNIPIKRYFLPFVGIFALTILPEFRGFIYLPIVVTCGFLIIFWNFSWIVYYTASKPLYYEDLFIDEKKLPNYEVDDKIKIKFKMILETVLIITNALLTGALAEYYLYKTTGSEGYIEIIGVTGGIIKMFQLVNNAISRFMLKILKECVKKENLALKKRQIEGIEKIIRLKRHRGFMWNEISEINAQTNEINEINETNANNNASGIEMSQITSPLEITEHDANNEIIYRERADTL